MQRPLVVTPTFNEVENLERLVDGIHQAVPAAHVLVVDDDSPDGTGRLANRLSARHTWVHVEHRSGKLGLGSAYIHGFRWGLARDYGLLVEMDADLSHRPSDLPRLIAGAETADLVLGCRYMEGGATPDWARHRRWISRAGNRYARWRLQVPYRDLTGGFKCFRRCVLEKIPLSELQSEGYAFQIELTWRAHRAGFRVAELPIVFDNRAAGVSKMSKKIVFEAARLVWRMGAVTDPAG